MSTAIFERESVSIKQDAIGIVRAMIRTNKFYRQEEEDKKMTLKALSVLLSRVYEIEPPTTITFGGTNCYRPDSIELENTSVISFLHEYRHHMQRTLPMFEGMSVEEDARAFSLALFSKASPKNFENSVKDGRILFVKWSEEENKVVDDEEMIAEQNSLAGFADMFNNVITDLSGAPDVARQPNPHFGQATIETLARDQEALQQRATIEAPNLPAWAQRSTNMASTWSDWSSLAANEEGETDD